MIVRTIHLYEGGGDNDGGDMGGDLPIPAKVESGGSSGESALTAATEPIGSVPTKMDAPTSQFAKSANGLGWEDMCSKYYVFK